MMKTQRKDPSYRLTLTDPIGEVVAIKDLVTISDILDLDNWVAQELRIDFLNKRKGGSKEG